MPLMTFFHPEMQETLLNAAAEGGVEVRRSAAVRFITAAPQLSVTLDENGRREKIGCGFLVGADGRGSSVRKWGNFSVTRDPDRLLLGGF
jgi:menaquinone-9 beta-reductase